MSSLLTSFDVGVTGIRTAQSGVNTTSHNLVNVNTEGYSRQQVIGVDRGYNSIGASYISHNQVGLGSAVTMIKQVRDVFYDKAYRLEVGRKSFYQVQSDAVDEVETLMGEMEGVEFQETLKDVWIAMEELVKEPDSLVKRTSLINTCNSFVARAQDIYAQLKDYQLNLNRQVTDAVNRVNQIGQEIFEMNKQIVKAEVGGQEHANDFRDQRNNLLDELGSYASITYYEDYDGRVLVNVEGTQFVAQDFVYNMKFVKNEENNLYDVVWRGEEPVFNLDQGFSSELDTDVGKIKSLLFARGDSVAVYTDIPERTDAKYYDEDGEFKEEAYRTDLIAYNRTINSSVIASTEAYFDKLVNAVVTAVNDAISPNEKATTMFEKMGMELNTTQITYTNASGNEVTVDDLDKLIIWDEYISGVGMDEDRTCRAEIFSRQSVERYTEAVVSVTDKDGNTYDKKIWIYNEEDPADPFTLYTIDQIVLNQEVLDNPSILGLSGNNYLGHAGGYDADACKRMTAIWENVLNTVDPNNATSFTLLDYYDALVGDIATIGNQYRTTTDTQKSLVDSIDSNRSSVSGVSSDEELTNLIMYQYAYTASARYITTVDEMLEDVLNKLG